jgi:predicted nucleotidyltransferase component of viral defense system
MIALTQKDVLAHQVLVPWSEPYQVEQDLLLCLAMRAIFEDQFLAGQVAMRGGTVLHKVHLAPAARYSEDIDLVAVGDRPEGHIRSLRTHQTIAQQKISAVTMLGRSWRKIIIQLAMPYGPRDGRCSMHHKNRNRGFCNHIG